MTEHAFEVRVLHDESSGAYLCHIIGLGLYDSTVNLILPLDDAKKLGRVLTTLQALEGVDEGVEDIYLPGGYL